jgi:ankyrin repeat protein
MNYDDIDQTESSNSNIFLELMLEENWLAAKEFLKNSTVEFPMLYKEIGKTALDFAIEQVFKIENDEKFDEIKQLIESLFERGDSISYNRQYFGTNSLHILLYHDLSIKYQIEILKISLKHISSKEINCYDVFGKTPLLEAIEKRNEEAAIELLKHPEIDPNLFKIECEKEFTHCSETIRTGTSTLEAARISGLSKVAELIQNHPKYNPNSRYVNLTSDVLYRYFDHYAACGNVDTLKTFLQQVDLKDFLTPDTVSGWTVLHIACFSGNLEVIGFLLNKEALEKASCQEISEKDFKEFINCSDVAQGVALGRALHASRKFPEQAKLFINCPQFDPNKILTFPSRVLLHNLLEMDQKDLIIELAKRKDFDIDLRDGSKNTALRIACDTDNVEMVKLLIGIGEMNGIDTSELNKGEAPVMKYLNNYSEETWFGEKTSQILFPETEEELTVNDLYRIYENGDPLNVLVSYKKYFCASEIEFINGVSSE